jgi:DNA-binding response OmpR family regulator
MKAKILLVDDEKDAIELIQYNLEEAGYQVISAADGLEALRMARGSAPDLIVLDLMLPELDGLEVCKILRRDPATAGIPTIMLTAKASEVDRVLGLEIGADDYITKPFSPRELVLRVKKLLQRGAQVDEHSEVLGFGEVIIDISRHTATVHGKRVDLTATEFKLLSMLVQRRGRVQSRDQLLQDVWGYNEEMDSRTVDTHIRRLRQKLGRSAKYIGTVRGFGYQLLDQ